MNNKKKMFLISLITLLPIVAGLLLWNRLPESMPIHFGPGGEADGYSSKAFAVFFLPLFLFAIHWFCLVITMADPKRRAIGEKAFGMVLWICPFVSLLVAVAIYSTALGVSLPIDTIFGAAFGVMFMVIGNYLPKCRQNYTVGIKLPWTLHDEENWNRTHRLAGKIWVICGALILLFCWWKPFWLMIGLLFPMVFIPAVYSYCLAQKKK